MKDRDSELGMEPIAFSTYIIYTIRCTKGKSNCRKQPTELFPDQKSYFSHPSSGKTSGNTNIQDLECHGELSFPFDK